MAISAKTKKYPDTLYVVRVVDGDVEYFLSDEELNGLDLAENKRVRVGEYKRVRDIEVKRNQVTDILTEIGN